MAENIKEEVMTDSELDNVAGGNIAESKLDGKFLTKLFENQKGPYNKLTTIQDQWKKAGIRCEEGFGKKANRYYKNGVQISRADALVEALIFTGRNGAFPIDEYLD